MAESSSIGIPRLETLRQRAVNWRAPGPDPPGTQPPRPEGKGWHASDEFYPALTDPHLVRIAGALFIVEFSIIRNYCSRRIDHYKTNPEQLTDGIRSSMRQAEEYLAEFREIQTGARQIGTQYMKGRQMLSHWTEFYHFFSSPKYKDGKTNSIDWHFIDMNVLGHAIVQAGTTTTLDDEVTHFLEERWHRFDTFLQLTKDWRPRRGLVPSWEELQIRIVDARKKRPRQALQSQSTLVWLILATTVSNTITFALTYNYSPHLSGAWHDADFWSLIQQAITQVIGFTITMIPILKNTDVPRWAWLTIGFFVVGLTVISVPLYTFAPTEWSSFTMLVGGAIQTFLTLQLAILGF